MIFKMNQYVAGDVFQIIWSFWWVKHALLDFHTNLFYSNYIFYPVGMDLSLYVLTYFNTLFSLPLQYIFNEIVTYNIMDLFSFVMSGFGVYLLVKYLTKNTRAAFISGLIFAFCPFRFAHAMGHLTVLSTEWIPFYVLYLIRTTKEKSLKNPILAGFFLSLASLGEWHYLLFLSMFTLLFLIYHLKIDFNSIFNKKFSFKFFILLFVFFLITTPFLIPIIKNILTNPSAGRPLDPSVIASADIFGFFIPASFHPIFGKYVAWAYERFTRNIQEDTVFLGYTTLALSIYALFKVDKKKTRFWLITAIIFFILALGPLLHIFGRFIYPSPIPLGSLADSIGLKTSQLGHDLLNKFIGIPLPYLILHLYVPFFTLLREPGRFTILVILSLSVLSGYGASKLFEKNNKKKNIIFLVISLVILFEFLAFPIQLFEFNIPEFYKRLAQDKQDYAILEAPIYYCDGCFMAYQTIHNKKIVNGAFTRKSPNTTSFIDSTPLVQALEYPITARKYYQNQMISKIINANPEAADIIKKYLEAEGDIYSYSETNNKTEVQPSKQDIKKLQENNIKYIIIHKDYLDVTTFEKMNDLVRNLLNNKPPFYEDKQLIVYEIL